MAVDFLSQYGGEFFEVFSVQDPRNVNQMTWQVMNEIGHNPSNPITKPICGENDPQYDYVVTLGCQSNINDLDGNNNGEKVEWCIEDPTISVNDPEQSLEQYRSVRDQIQAAVLDWLFEKGVALD